jgi:D-aminopeptidase
MKTNIWRRTTALACGLTSMLFVSGIAGAQSKPEPASPRARDAGIVIGILPPGRDNAITDVAGVRVGHATLIEGERVHTGVTAILPHDGNLFQDKVPGGFSVANGFGKFMGSTQVKELGEIETPILLTNTLSVPEAAAAAIEWTLKQPGNEKVQSVNSVVGETNDGTLNDIRARLVTAKLATQAIDTATTGPVTEGAVGAGTGTVAFGFKGGIGTSSRVLPARLGGYTVGVLVQSNYGGVLTIAGAPIGQMLGRYLLKDELSGGSGDGSIVIVIATDAPLSDRNLERLASRAFLGVARTGSPITNGSGDYAIAFSTSPAVRRSAERRATVANYTEVGNDQITPLFQAVTEATEEAIINSLFAARTVKGYRGTVEKLPVDMVVEAVRHMHAK